MTTISFSSFSSTSTSQLWWGPWLNSVSWWLHMRSCSHSLPSLTSPLSSGYFRWVSGAQRLLVPLGSSMTLCATLELSCPLHSATSSTAAAAAAVTDWWEKDRSRYSAKDLINTCDLTHWTLRKKSGIGLGLIPYSVPYLCVSYVVQILCFVIVHRRG